jgi:hypothetical protein
MKIALLAFSDAPRGSLRNLHDGKYHCFCFDLEEDEVTGIFATHTTA